MFVLLFPVFKSLAPWSSDKQSKQNLNKCPALFFSGMIQISSVLSATLTAICVLLSFTRRGWDPYPVLMQTEWRTTNAIML